MRIFVTGGTGFLSAHLLSRLVKETVELGVLIRPSGDLWRIQDLTDRLQIVRGDLGKISAWQEELRKFHPDVIIHLAWAGVGNKHRNDSQQIDANLMPTVALTRLGIEAGAKTFIGLGSQAEYGPLNKRISEEDVANPTTLYGTAKLAACILMKQLCEQAGVRFAWLRVFSTYGPMEDPDWMIPYLIRTLLGGEKPALTACEQKWDYLFGPDAAEAIWQIALSPNANGIFNLGSGQVYTLRKIVETIRDMIDPALELGFGQVPYRPDQVMHLEADISRLRAATGWTPATPLEEGLRQTIEWHSKQKRA
jgi:UDP-glucose 4-epimerase